MIDNYKPAEWLAVRNTTGDTQSADAEYAAQLTAATGEHVSPSRVKNHRFAIGQFAFNQNRRGGKRKKKVKALGYDLQAAVEAAPTPKAPAVIEMEIGGIPCKGTPQALQALLGI